MERKRKCLIVYHFFAHYRLHLLQHLMDSNDWDFELVSDSKTVAGIKGIDPALADINVSAGGLRWSFVRNWYVLGVNRHILWQHGLIKRLKSVDYDAVIFLGSIHFLTTWIGQWIVRRKGKRVIFWTHGFLGKDNAFLAFLRHQMYSRSDFCLLYGNRARNLMLASGRYKESQLRVVYNSLDYSSMERLRISFKETDRVLLRRRLFEGFEELPILIAIGRVNAVKRVDLLLEAVAKINSSERKVNCLIVGDGLELPKLKEMASALNFNDSIRFFGAAYGKEADKLLLSSDICVIPGNVGLSAMHAHSAGLPVISHDAAERQMPEHEAIVEGVTGSLFKYGCSSSLADVLLAWIMDKRRIEVAKKSCRGVVEEKYNHLYQTRIIMETLNEKT